MKATVPKRPINEGYCTETHYQRRLLYRNALSMKATIYRDALSMKATIPKRTTKEGYYTETYYQ